MLAAVPKRPVRAVQDVHLETTTLELIDFHTAFPALVLYYHIILYRKKLRGLGGVL
jgi:hypothetical protein